MGLRVCDRVLTALLYLNQDWLPEHGGCLRLYRPEPGREEEILQGVCPLLPRPCWCVRVTAACGACLGLNAQPLASRSTLSLWPPTETIVIPARN